MAAAIACAPLGAASAAATTGNVAGWVKNATFVGPASGSTSVTIAVHMNLTNMAELKTLVSQLSDPSSA